ncbi:MAG TPA: ankyrin repeat domain-containing protein [Pyrinomonadaceae bacterium]|nr:ankyrin repeat domain-containing protein [Pyrinomonadaceae bacterium]
MSSSISLTNAVTSGDESTVSALLANGADVNETTNGGQTALILAVIFGHTNVVRMLMNAGANPQLRDNLGLNAIEWAQRRGLNEAYAILTTRPDPSTRPRRIVIPVEETEKPVVEAPPAPRNDEVKSPGSEEKSKRWVDGVKQRLDEQAMRRLNRNEPTPERRAVREDPPPPPPEPPKETIITSAPRILAPPPVEPAKSPKRKRCPECNEIYNADLVAYCSQHMVPLVDLDSPIVAEAPKQKNGPLFWILLAVTLAGSLVMGSLITTYVYKANQTATPAVAEPQNTIQKGTPEVSTELAGKAVSLPEAECPMRGAEIMSGTVTVRILVDKSGQVNWARGSGGDWLMRGCSTEAAMKATFDAQKLRNRETEGTITYTFKP